MKNLYIAFQVESLKTRRSSAFKVSIFLFVFISAMMCLPVFVAKYPGLSEKMGMMGNKMATMSTGAPDWINFSEQLLQGIAGVGFIGIGFVSSWIFGREFADKTVKDLLALPVSRTHIIFAKFLVILCWSALLYVVYLLVALLIGYSLGLPEGSIALLLNLCYRFGMAGLLTILLATPTAFLASYSKGVLLPLGVTVLTMILANLSAMVGLAALFPWAIPGSFVAGKSVGIEVHTISYLSYLILGFTSAAGAWATWNVWLKTDQQ